MASEHTDNEDASNVTDKVTEDDLKSSVDSQTSEVAATQKVSRLFYTVLKGLQFHLSSLKAGKI